MLRPTALKPAIALLFAATVLTAPRVQAAPAGAMFTLPSTIYIHPREVKDVALPNQGGAAIGVFAAVEGSGLFVSPSDVVTVEAHGTGHWALKDTSAPCANRSGCPRGTLSVEGPGGPTPIPVVALPTGVSAPSVTTRSWDPLHAPAAAAPSATAPAAAPAESAPPKESASPK